MATVTVDQAKLVLNSFAAIFQNNLVSKDLVTWRKFDGEMNDRNRLTVVEQVVPNYVVTQTVDGVANLTSGVQDTVFGSEQFTLNRTFGSSMGWGDFVKIRDLGAARESEALKSAALKLATQIDAYILGYATLASNSWLGTPGTAVSEWDDIASGYTRLKEQGVEDPDLRFVGTYGDKQALGSLVLGDNASLTDIGAGIYREGFSGSVAGIPTLFTQQLPTMVTGSRATVSALTQGTTDAPVAYSAVAVSPAPGQYLTQTITIDVGSATETVREGEVFTIDGVFAYDNRLQAAQDHLQQFRVVGGTGSNGINAGVYTASGGVVTVRIFPAIIVPATTPGGSNADVNTANATVAQAPGNTAAVTFLGAPSASIKPRLLMNKSAVIVNTADLIMPATGIGTRKSLTKVPLSVRMWQNSVFATGDHEVRFDIAVTANVSGGGRLRTARVNGS
jgi:hypothetical protein